MNILYLSTDAHGARGGIAQYNRDVLEALANFNECSKVTVLSRNIEEELIGLPKKISYSAKTPLGKFSYFLLALRQIPMPTDIIICAHINLLPIAILLSRSKKVPVVLLIYGIDVWEKPRIRWLAYYLKKISLIISISRHTAVKFSRWSSVPIDTIAILHNAIHLHQYRLQPKNESLVSRYGLEGCKVLLTVGRMSASEAYKGFDEVIEALPAILKQGVNVKYLICGDGDDRQRLEAKVRLLDLSQHVVFSGYVKECEKLDHYCLADLYVMPSHGEGFGFVILEALACGLPVIASTVDGTSEAVANGKLGKMVDPKDADALVYAINKSLELPRQIPLDLNDFSFEQFSKRLYPLLKSLEANI